MPTHSMKFVIIPEQMGIIADHFGLNVEDEGIEEDIAHCLDELIDS